MTINFQPNEPVQMDGRHYLVGKQNKEGKWTLEDANEGYDEFRSDLDIADMMAKGTFTRLQPENMPEKLSRMIRRAFSSFKPREQAAARRRLRYIRYYEEHGMHLPFSDNMKDFMIEAARETGDTETPPSWKTLYAWWRLWCLGGKRNIRCLIPDTASKGNRRERLHPEVRKIMQKAIHERYLCAQKGDREYTMRDTHTQVRKDVLEYRAKPGNDWIEVPAERTVRAEIARYSKYDQSVAREGKEVADRRYRYTLAAPITEYPLQGCEIDHTEADIIVIDAKTGEILGRPWLTVIIDRATRMVIGIFLSMLPPSAYTVMACIVNAILPKHYIADLADLSPEDWPCFGIPEMIVSDNASEFKSVQFQDAMDQLGILYEPAPVHDPEYKGIVERFFGTVAEQFFWTMPGTTFGNINRRGDRNPSKAACLSLEDVNKLLHRWVVLEYNRSVNSGLGTVPLMAWNNLTQDHPTRPVDGSVDLAMLMLEPVIRVIQDTGIRYENLDYQDRYLNELRKRGVHEVEIRINRFDLGEVYFLDPDTGRYHIAVCTKRNYAKGLTLDQHEVLQKITREAIGKHYSLDDLARTKVERWAAVDKAAARGRRVRASNGQKGVKPRTKAEIDEHVQQTEADRANAISKQLSTGSTDDKPRSRRFSGHGADSK